MDTCIVYRLVWAWVDPLAMCWQGVYKIHVCKMRFSLIMAHLWKCFVIWQVATYNYIDVCLSQLVWLCVAKVFIRFMPNKEIL